MNPYLLNTLEFGPVVVERFFNFIPPDKWDFLNDPNRFTPREVAAHLCDWEPILLERIKSALQKPGITIAVFDESQRAIDNNYSTTNPMQQIEKWKQHRKNTAHIIYELQKDDWSRFVIHPERGIQTIEDQANLILGHDLYHIEQLSEYLLV